MLRTTDTIAALATPAGTAAIAVVRVSGPDTQRLAGELVGRLPPPRVARHCDYRDGAGTLVDDVLITVFVGPHSYTGEDALEVSCHGNPFIAQKILEDLLARGCRPAEPGEFTQRAFLNGRMDLSQAEAVMDLIRARSDRALAAAQQQLRGELGRRINELIEALLGVLARIEAYIDFPEEDLPPEDRAVVILEVERVAQEAKRLLATSHFGELLRDGIKTVILGPPNVGKSSLLNRLVGRQRALVSAEPGTTRDFIEERIILGPHCLRLIDTAGVRATTAALEKLGIEQTLLRAAEADLCLLVLDATQPELPVPAEVVARMRADAAIVVINKVDLAPESGALPDCPPGIPVLQVSALTGAGFDALVEAISARVDSFQREAGGETIAVNARHARALTEAKEGLERAKAKLSANEAVELTASDLRFALAAFGEITGKVDNERMLDQLFASFCIGK